VEGEVGFGFETPEREVFELIADGAHAEAVSNGGINVERFAGDTLLLSWGRNSMVRML